MASAPRADSPSASVHAERSAGRGPRVPLGVAIAMSLGGVVIGFALARLAPWNGQAPTPPSAEARAPAETQASEPVAAAVSSASIGTPPPAEARPGSVSAPAKRRATVRHPEPPTYVRASGTGVLDVSAPEGAEIWLDGRHVGTGNTRKQISEGDHRVEVRHNGASVGERFHVAPGETWTYAVTPR